MFAPMSFDPPDPFDNRDSDPPVPRTADQLARGGLLNILLSLITFGAIIGFALNALGFIALKRAIGTSSELAVSSALIMKQVIFATLLSGVRLGCAMGMWSWKKWGVYGYVAISVILFFLSARTDPQHRFSYSHLVWLALVLGAALPKWNLFQD